MRKTIKIGARDVELECNLGTSYFFEELTGKNLFDLNGELTAHASELKNIQSNAAEGRTQAEYRKELGKHTSEFMPTFSKMISIAKGLAYVMNLQATHGQTKEDISKIRGELNINSFIAWQLQFENNDFTIATYTEVMHLWNAQKENHSESKN